MTLPKSTIVTVLTIVCGRFVASAFTTAVPRRSFRTAAAAAARRSTGVPLALRRRATTATVLSSSVSPTPDYDDDDDEDSPGQQRQKQQKQPITDDTLAINSVGTAVTEKTTYDFSLESESILAIDPSTIDIYELGRDDDDGGSKSSLASPTTTTPSPPPPDFVGMFRGSANYIANHRNTIVVYHVPGELLEAEYFPELMDDVALTWLLGMKPVIVAGCRKQIDDKIRRRSDERKRRKKRSSSDGAGGGLGEDDTMPEREGEEDEESGKRRYRNSIRVTDYDDLRVVKEEAGYVRFELERQLGRALRMHQTPQPKRHRETSASVAGPSHDHDTKHRRRRRRPPTTRTSDQHRSPDDDTDPSSSDHRRPQDGNVVSGNFYSAQPYGVIDGIDFKYTGFPRRIEVEKIRQATLVANDVVLLTNLGASPSGEVFNVNSENLAASVAGALGASKLIFFMGGNGGGGTSGNGKEDGGGVTFRRRIGAGVGKEGWKPLQNLRVSDAKGLLKYHGVAIDPKRGFATVEETETGVHTPAVREALTKVGWGVAALEAGVKRTHINLYEGIRPGNVHDVTVGEGGDAGAEA